MKKMKMVKGKSTRMNYPDLGELKNWVIVGFSDASVNSMPDRVGSVGGQVILAANKKTDRACVLSWRSKQLHRVVHSSLAAEAFSLLELFGDLKYTRLTLQQLYGKQVFDIPFIAITDSKNLWQAVHTIKNVEDKRLINTIVELKEAMALDKCAQELRHLPGEFMLADGLTKKGASSDELMLVLQTGRFQLRGGWDVINRSGFTLRDWMRTNEENFEDEDVEK